jgi:hypothetical protein
MGRNYEEFNAVTQKASDAHKREREHEIESGANDF